MTSVSWCLELLWSLKQQLILLEKAVWETQARLKHALSSVLTYFLLDLEEKQSLDLP